MDQDETREYIRDGRAPIPESEVTSRVMSANRPKDTKPELLMRWALRQVGISGYRLHWKNTPGRPDIAYPGRKIAIFVNGCYWHRCPRCNLSLPKSNTEWWRAKFEGNKERDKRKKLALEEVGWKVFVIWECELKDNPLDCALRIKSFIEFQDAD